jgi:hypothetical protein
MLKFAKEKEMIQDKTRQATPATFKKKIGNTTYTVRVHFNTATDETFENKIKRLIVNDYLQTAEMGNC